MQVLSFNEIEQASGGDWGETGYSVSVGVGMAFFGLAVIASAPLAAGLMAGASIVSSGFAIYYAM